MFVSDLSVEKWVGNQNQGTLIENPTWQQIESAISELNGNSQTLVTLGADEESYMSIGGGAGNYIVNVTFDGMTFYNLVDHSQPEKIEKLTIGGQLGNYSAKLCVDLQAALLVAKTFAQSGTLEESVNWEDLQSLTMVG
ncbi:Imm1 family immunity protein [[Phormidium] sp. ETS-05]|uniref:Imm1 family immunity protein n=1 Tax=[Phormidium] sp. ETS-05 TaxID=222819 RepID=UPI0018EEF0BC|nr:Imm1 family immunity protein [[Phormidium] sp. ETS-05]